MILDRARPVSETPTFIKLLLYGPPGVGKTTFAASSPNPLYVDFERSSDVLKFTPGLQHTRVVQPKNVKDLHEIINAFPSSEFETIVLDSISQMQDFQLDDHMKLKFKGKTDDVNRYLPLFKEFRISTEVMKEIFRILQGINKNVVLIAHDRTHTEKRESASGETVDRPVGIAPDMTPRVNDSVRRLINIFAYYDKETSLKGEVTRKLYVNPSGLIHAKNRLNIQETFLVNPSWKTLVKEPLK